MTTCVMIKCEMCKNSYDMLSMTCAYCSHNPQVSTDNYQPKPTDPADDWRYGWEPEYNERYLAIDTCGSLMGNRADSDNCDKFRISMGNCWPDSPRGRLLAKAWAKYMPELIKDYALVGEVSPAAKVWFDRKYNCTIEEAEAAAGGEA